MNLVISCRGRGVGRFTVSKIHYTEDGVLPRSRGPATMLRWFSVFTQTGTLFCVVAWPVVAVLIASRLLTSGLFPTPCGVCVWVAGAWRDWYLVATTACRHHGTPSG